MPSSELELPVLAIPAQPVAVPSFDRVMDTAEDRPTHDSLPPLVDPAADHETEVIAARRADIEHKHRQVTAFLDAAGYDALVLGRADSIAWFTGGAEVGQGLGTEDASVLLYINGTSRAVLTDNVQSARVFEEELAGLGFQLKERPWHDQPERIAAELGTGRHIATDTGLFGWPNELPRLRELRLSLTKRERQVLRELGRTLTLTLEATCRNFNPGETEADVAGHLAHRLIREGVVPLAIRVAGDDRLVRYRRPAFKAVPIHRRAVISATGRRHGLCASASRIVSFGPPDAEFRAWHAVAAMVDATFIFFSRAGETVARVFQRARRIYEKFGHPHEWTLDYQGVLIGYAAQEALLQPDSPRVLQPESAVCWSPSVAAARSEDTIVVDSRGGFEVVTEAQRWPKLDVAVKGFPIPRPGILER